MSSGYRLDIVVRSFQSAEEPDQAHVVPVFEDDGFSSELCDSIKS